MPVQITNRSSQARGEYKSKARPLVAPAFGINAERPAREIRNLVEDLLDRMNLLYKVRQHYIHTMLKLLTTQIVC